LLVSAFSSIIPGANAQDKPLKKINWGVTSLSAGNWIPWIAKEAKIYDKHGLDVQLVLLRGSGQTSAALLGGSIFAAPVVLPTLMLADLSGADLINVALLFRREQQAYRQAGD
jgi:ABC-type nitrate/sulfonate/bicarbonate transport system substrate-binding protein